MKGIILSLAFLCVALSERLDNKYLPPNNAHIDTTDYPANAPVVDISRSAKPNSQFLPQASESRSQYSAPNTRNGEAPSRQYLPGNQFPSGTFGQQSKPLGSSITAFNQYSRQNGQVTGPSGVFQHPASSVPSTFYTKPNGQFQHAVPSNQRSSPSVESFNQFNKPNGQFSGTSQYSGPSSYQADQYSNTNAQFPSTYQQPKSSIQPSAASNEYVRPSGQFSGTTQYTKPNAQFPSTYQQPNSFIQPSAASHEYVRPSGQFSGTSQYSGQSTIPANKFSEPKGQSSGSFKLSEPSSPSLIPSSQYSKSNGQYGTPPANQYSGFNSQTSPAGQYSAGQYQNGANQIAIVRSSIVPNSGDGYYSYNYETENGISAQEEGTLVNNAGTAKGGYSYTSPEGEKIVVEYTADEDGFKPAGSHIPQIPEAILKSIESNKAAEARGEYQEGQYQEDIEQRYAKSGPVRQYGYNPKFASPIKAQSPFLNSGFVQQTPSSGALSQADGFSSFGQNGYNHAATSGFPRGTGSVSGGVAPHLNFGASEPLKGYATPNSQYGTVQNGKGGYKY